MLPLLERIPNMTVKDFLWYCTQDWIDIVLYNQKTGESITICINEIDDYDDIANSEVMGWDMTDDGIISINYEL